MYYIAIKNKKITLWDTTIEAAAYEDGWDDESEVSAEEFIRNEGYFLIPVPDIATAQEIAIHYDGDFKDKVHDKAFEIISGYGFDSWQETKKKQIDFMVKSGDISFAKINDSTIEVFFRGESSEFKKDEFGDWDYDQTVPIMLDINGDEDLVVFLLKSLGVENDD